MWVVILEKEFPPVNTNGGNVYEDDIGRTANEPVQEVRRLPSSPDFGSLPNDLRAADRLKENDNAR